MQPTNTLTTLFSHHQWANLTLLERCAELTDDQLEATVSGTFGSIRDTLQHIVTSEQSYLYRIQTGQSQPDPDEEPTLTVAEMTDLARTTGAGLIEWAAKVQVEGRVQVVWRDGAIRPVPKTIFLTQVINHAIEHRTQITAIMTQLGIEPPDLQPWEYFDEIGR